MFIHVEKLNTLLIIKYGLASTMARKVLLT